MAMDLVLVINPRVPTSTAQTGKFKLNENSNGGQKFQGALKLSFLLSIHHMFYGVHFRCVSLNF